MMAYWAAFARSGDPNGDGSAGLVRWEPFALPDGRFVVLDTAAGGGIRMASGLLSTEAVLAGVEHDPVLVTTAAKCDVYRSFVDWARDPSPAAYPSLLAGACAAFPLARAAGR